MSHSDSLQVVLFRGCCVVSIYFEITNTRELKIRLSAFVIRGRLNKRIIVLANTTVYVSSNPSVMIHA